MLKKTYEYLLRNRVTEICNLTLKSPLKSSTIPRTGSRADIDSKLCMHVLLTIFYNVYQKIFFFGSFGDLKKTLLKTFGG